MFNNMESLEKLLVVQYFDTLQQYESDFVEFKKSCCRSKIVEVINTLNYYNSVTHLEYRSAYIGRQSPDRRYNRIMTNREKSSHFYLRNSMFSEFAYNWAYQEWEYIKCRADFRSKFSQKLIDLGIIRIDVLPRDKFTLDNEKKLVTSIATNPGVYKNKNTEIDALFVSGNRPKIYKNDVSLENSLHRIIDKNNSVKLSRRLQQFVSAKKCSLHLYSPSIRTYSSTYFLMKHYPKIVEYITKSPQSSDS